jgi:hypothetical protein
MTFNVGVQTYIHTTHAVSPVAEASQIFLRDAHGSPKLRSYEEYYKCDRW